MHLNSILETEEERFVKKQTVCVIENIKPETFRPFSSPFHFHFLRSEYATKIILSFTSVHPFSVNQQGLT